MPLNINEHFKRKADLLMCLSADSGYTSTETHRVSADQWRRILTICSEAGREKKPQHDRYDISDARVAKEDE